MKTYKVTLGNMVPTMKAIGAMVAKGVASGPVSVKVGRETRNDQQNRKLWPVLRDISQQVTIGGNKLADDQWKIVLSAAFRDQKWMPGLRGSLISVPLKTSKMTKRDFSDFLEFIFSFGADPQDYGAETEDGGPIRWSDPALEAYKYE